mmetsp:Transcript_1256/g.1290  ORF Transcript_1256/g.1290 Transcript_1256/m.1290 type:complete len:387 (+) Transcript_1256:358-1518(+)
MLRACPVPDMLLRVMFDHDLELLDVMVAATFDVAEEHFFVPELVDGSEVGVGRRHKVRHLRVLKRRLRLPQSSLGDLFNDFIWVLYVLHGSMPQVLDALHHIGNLSPPLGARTHLLRLLLGGLAPLKPLHSYQLLLLLTGVYLEPLLVHPMVRHVEEVVLDDVMALTLAEVRFLGVLFLVQLHNLQLHLPSLPLLPFLRDLSSGVKVHWLQAVFAKIPRANHLGGSIFALFVGGVVVSEGVDLLDGALEALLHEVLGRNRIIISQSRRLKDVVLPGVFIDFVDAVELQVLAGDRVAPALGGPAVSVGRVHEGVPIGLHLLFLSHHMAQPLQLNLELGLLDALVRHGNSLLASFLLAVVQHFFLSLVGNDGVPENRLVHLDEWTLTV